MTRDSAGSGHAASAATILIASEESAANNISFNFAGRTSACGFDYSLLSFINFMKSAVMALD